MASTANVNYEIEEVITCLCCFEIDGMVPVVGKNGLMWCTECGGYLLWDPVHGAVEPEQCENCGEYVYGTCTCKI